MSPQQLMTDGELDDGVTASGYSPYPAVPQCSRPACLRSPYAEGLCKRHRDEEHYARMRELERKCHPGTRVRCRAGAELYMKGTARSSVRLVARDGLPGRDRWPTVMVQLDGHNETLEWRAIDVEVA